MNQSEYTTWFGGLSNSAKAIVLLRVMWELTLVMRSIFRDDANDCATRSRLAYNLSELNHRLTAASSDILQGVNTFPDDVLVAMLFDPTPQPELSPYFPFVLEQARKFYDNHVSV